MSRLLAVLVPLLVLAAPSVDVRAADPADEGVRIPSLPEQLYRQWVIEEVRPDTESRERLRTRDDVIERLSLREAVAIALENNPGIAVERLGPARARAEIDRVNGAFDPIFRADGSVSRIVSPVSSALAGALVLRQKETRFGFGVEKLLRTGATFEIAANSEELNTNSRFTGLRPQYKPTLDFSIEQPLLRNFGIDLTILLVRSAEAGSAIAYYQYEARIAALVKQVVQAYWRVVQARESLKAEEDGLRLARALVKDNEARVRAGTLPPVAVKEASAEAASREARVISAENEVAVAGDALRLLLQRNPGGTFLPRAIDPADSPDVREIETDDQLILENAIGGRPEILLTRYDLQNRKILAKVKRNNLLPSLDLKAAYGLNGLSGRAVPQRSFDSGEIVVTPFDGDYGRGLDRLSSNDFNSYSAGFAFSVPLGNNAAEAEFVQSQIDVRRGELGYKQLLADVTLEVRRTIADVRASSKRITATRLARELAAETLDQQRKRYEVGLSTTKDLLDFQQRLTSARAEEIRALVDYNVSVASLRQAEGTLLEQFDIVLEALPPAPTPFWARF
ncbi:MAG: TolC family protein [Candidatus Binatia bacterium]